jgi:hypothetical protein
VLILYSGHCEQRCNKHRSSSVSSTCWLISFPYKSQSGIAGSHDSSIVIQEYESDFSSMEVSQKNIFHNGWSSLPTVLVNYKTSPFSTYSLSFVIFCLISLWFWFTFPWWLVMSNIFSWSCWPFLCLKISTQIFSPSLIGSYCFMLWSYLSYL